MGSGFRVGCEFRVQGVSAGCEFREGVSSGCRVWGEEMRISSRFRVVGLGFQVSGFRFQVSGLWFRV